MKIEIFKDLIVWQRSIQVVKEIYKITSLLPSSERFGLCSQMQRAAVSIPSNIAEGHSRNHRREYVQFLSIAYGSCSELETQVIISKDLYPVSGYDEVESLLFEVQKMLGTLIQRLK